MAERGRLLGAWVLLLVLTGCSDEPRTTLAEARSEYPALVGDVAGALADDLGVEATPTAGSLAPGEDGGTCWFRSATWTMPGVLGVDVPIDDVRDTVERIAEPEGWEVTDDEIPGGYEGFDMGGPGGATLEVRARSESEVRIVALVDGDCERTTLPVE